MGFNSVYRSLQEVFPQVDVRILKAVAIEHSKDADAAVEFILLEVLPSISNFSAGPHSSHDLSNPPVGAAETEDQSFSLKIQQVVGEGASSGPLSKARFVASEDVTNTSHTNGCHFVNSAFQDEGSATFYVSSNNASSDDKKPECSGTEEMISLVENQELSATEPNQGSCIALSSLIDGNAVVNDLPMDTSHAVVQDLNESVIVNSNSTIGSVSYLDQLWLGRKVWAPENSPGNDLDVPSSVYEDTVNNAECGLASKNDYSASVEEFDEAGKRGQLEIADEQEDCVTEMVEVENESVSQQEGYVTGTAEVENESISKPMATSSGQICRTDLESSFEVAKNNKKILFSTMESIGDMLREVERQEEATQETKEAADRGGQDILDRVEDLKRMLHHAKEANDMRAGKVYGERAILATEMREFQSRLLSLSAEMDKSLEILDEMHRTLEAQLASAEEERKAAEQEKLQKEEAARKALAEQELNMDKVVQESRRLQESEEENSKLREFLVDHGHIVDVLQGKIAVICKDVKVLKEKVDKRVPLSKSVSSSQSSCILASSNSSFRSMTSDQVLERTESLDTIKRMSSTGSNPDHSPKSCPEEEGIRRDLKSSLDDDWEIFEDKCEWNI